MGDGEEVVRRRKEGGDAAAVGTARVGSNPPSAGDAGPFGSRELAILLQFHIAAIKIHLDHHRTIIQQICF